MQKEVRVFDTNIPVFTRGKGAVPLLVVGPADLFRKRGFLPDRMDEIYKIYFVDIFSSKILIEESLVQNLTLDNFIEVIESLRDQLELDKFALFAHSAMGVLAYEYALRYSERVICLIMVASKPIWGEKQQKDSQCFFAANSDEDKKAVYEEDQRCLESKMKDNPRDVFIDRYLARRTWFFFRPKEKLPELIWQDIYHFMPFVYRYFELIGGYDIRSHAKPTVPIFLAMGLYDAALPFYLWTDDSKVIVEKICYYIFEESAHYPMIEEADSFMRELEAFMDKEVSSVSGQANSLSLSR